MIKAIVFDLDNTLMDFLARKEKSIDAAINAMHDAGLNISFKKIKKEIYKIYDTGFNVEDQLVFQKFLKKYKKEDDLKLIAKAVFAYRRIKQAETHTYPQVRNVLLQIIKRKIPIGIVSDGPKLSVWIRLTELGIDDFFDFVIAFDDTGANKSTDVPFTKVKTLLKYRPEDVLFVGDWPERDIFGAKRNGFKSCFAAYGYYGRSLPRRVTQKEISAIIKKYKPDYVLNKFSDILNVLGKENKWRN
ncbi:MAG: hypothetical protein COT14_02720 [Candidatus Diapherotrites archaeon CG08_land_8_20_14_0_20_30_16]|nr:MAG: hypothetical protein COT14_02720 [Candidatus Diapherotrites archaeon CG08_land_8_20_14_0_20_30_16]